MHGLFVAYATHIFTTIHSSHNTHSKDSLQKSASLDYIILSLETKKYVFGYNDVECALKEFKPSKCKKITIHIVTCE